MTYDYKKDDIIYDIESLNNIFTNAQWYPNKDTNKLVISYIDDYKLIKSDKDLETIKARILKVNPALKENNTKIVFEDLSLYPNVTKFVKRYGFATYETWNNFLSDNMKVNIRTQSGGKSTNFYRSQFDTPKQKPFNNYDNYFKITKDQELFNQITDIQKYDAIASGLATPSNQILQNPTLINSYFYPVKQTDPNYNPDAEGQGLRLGFNSTNYDLTLMAKQFNTPGNRELFRYSRQQLNDFYTKMQNSDDPQIRNKYRQILKNLQSIVADNWTAKHIRDINNQLFEPKYKNKMTDALKVEVQTDTPYTRKESSDAFYTHKGWLQTNRFYDIAQFNAHMTKVSLKRLSAFKLLQVKESDKLGRDADIIQTVDDFAELLAYNISDVVNTKDLFEDIAYQDTLKLHQELLNRFPELIYESKENVKRNPNIAKSTPNALYESDIHSDNLKYTRLTADSTSAKFVQYVIAPYLALEDNPAIDYHYPDAQILKEIQSEENVSDVVKNIKNPYDVLEDTKRWIKEQDAKYFGDKTPIWNQFKVIYQAYSDLRGRNINDNIKSPSPVNANDIINKYNTSIFYIGPDGQPSTSLVNFSIGGIHGAEINKDKYNEDRQIWEEKVNTQNIIKKYYHDDPVLAHQDKEVEIDGIKYDPRKSLKSGSTNKHAAWRDLSKSEPKIFTSDGKVKKKYAYVSIGQANHEDFSSFYPLLLSMLAVFRDNSGKDRYYGLYKERLALKAKLKTLDDTSNEYKEANMAQLVRKLLLNSASGQADAKFFSNIRKNNATVSMRVIGQLFAWRIGQAEALAGARIPSTNTDGLYTMDIEPELNNKVLAKTIEPMMIDVDPEIVYRFVSKDSNNRIEVVGTSEKDSRVVEAKGGSLTSWAGPGVTNNLNHPAIVDHVLAQYLAHEENPSNSEFNPEKAKLYMQPIIDDLKSEDDEKATKALGFFQWIIVSGLSKHRYPYIEIQHKDENNEFVNPSNDVEYEQYMKSIPHTNRVFLTKTPNDAVTRNTMKLATRSKPSNGKALKPGTETIKEQFILSKYGYNPYEDGYNPSIQKITDMPNDQNVTIHNQDLSRLSKEERISLINALDYEGYMSIIEAKFEKNWKNQVTEK